LVRIASSASCGAVEAVLDAALAGASVLDPQPVETATHKTKARQHSTQEE
jgi:hypothetical protein